MYFYLISFRHEMVSIPEILKCSVVTTTQLHRELNKEMFASTLVLIVCG